MFDTRILSRDPCQNPRVFFFDSVEEVTGGDYFVTSYIQTDMDRLLRACSKSEHSFTDYLYQIRVLSPLRRYNAVSWINLILFPVDLIFAGHDYWLGHEIKSFNTITFHACDLSF